MKLHSYVDRLETIIISRGDIEIEAMSLDVTDEDTLFEAELQFFDGSHLSLTERLEEAPGRDILRTNYKFHYQTAAEQLIFRYDNAPHHPEIATFPHHKHIGEDVLAAQPPDLTDVLAEIDGLLYPISSVI